MDETFVSLRHKLLRTFLRWGGLLVLLGLLLAAVVRLLAVSDLLVMLGKEDEPVRFQDSSEGTYILGEKRLDNYDGSLGSFDFSVAEPYTREVLEEAYYPEASSDPVFVVHQVGRIGDEGVVRYLSRPWEAEDGGVRIQTHTHSIVSDQGGGDTLIEVDVTITQEVSRDLSLRDRFSLLDRYFLHDRELSLEDVEGIEEVGFEDPTPPLENPDWVFAYEVVWDVDENSKEARLMWSEEQENGTDLVTLQACRLFRGGPFYEKNTCTANALLPALQQNDVAFFSSQTAVRASGRGIHHAPLFGTDK